MRSIGDAPPKIAVIGLGMAGLYQALEFTAHGHTVIGHDTSPARIDSVAAGRTGLPDVSDAALAARLASGDLEVHLDPAGIAPADAVLISVPTDIGADGAPDIGPVEQAARTVASHCRPGVLVVVKSTAYPGMVRERIAPVLRDALGPAETGGFALAYAPERGDPGNRNLELTAAMPKVIAGLTAACAERAAGLYRPFGGAVHVATRLETAEFVKLHENVFRFLNISYVNELGDLTGRMGVDIDEVVDLAATKPFGFMAFTAGAGVGGMYVPVNPAYLIAGARSAGAALKTVEAATEVNDGMPQTVIDGLERELGPLAGRKVLVLGVTYKPGSADLRRSPAAAVAARLSRTASVTAVDPHAAGRRIEHSDLTVQGTDDVDPSVFDLALQFVPHPALADLIARLPVPCFDVHGRTLKSPARSET
jgi:nucleotide sugar dehydrogenase